MTPFVAILAGSRAQVPPAWGKISLQSAGLSCPHLLFCDKEKENIAFVNRMAKAPYLCPEEKEGQQVCCEATDSAMLSSLQAGPRCGSRSCPAPSACVCMKWWVTGGLLHGLMQNNPLRTAFRHLAISLCRPLCCDSQSSSSTKLLVSGVGCMHLWSL